MKPWLAALAGALLLACCRSLEIPALPIRPADPEQDLGLYSFHWESSLCQRGVAFILEGEVWTARHVAYRSFSERDALCLGLAPITGLRRCREPHSVADKLSYPTERGRNRLLVIKDRGEMLDVVSEELMRPGESGSPVSCAAHDGVIAVMTHRIPGETRGIITRLPPEHGTTPSVVR